MAKLRTHLIDQLESSILILRTLNDHKERMAWASVVALGVYQGVMLQIEYSSLFILFIVLISSVVVYTTLVSYLFVQLSIGDEANLIIRACRYVLIQARSGAIDPTSDDFQPGGTPTEREDDAPARHPEWYPRIVLRTLNEYKSSMDTMSLHVMLRSVQWRLMITTLLVGHLAILLPYFESAGLLTSSLVTAVDLLALLASHAYLKRIEVTNKLFHIK